MTIITNVRIKGYRQGQIIEDITIEGYPSIDDAFNDVTHDFIVPMYRTKCDHVFAVLSAHSDSQMIGKIWADKGRGIKGRRFDI